MKTEMNTSSLTKLHFVYPLHILALCSMKAKDKTYR